ncbi:MAG TPA: calcium-binding protein [Solirubrobacterales bacterium]|nr:calcium-binding protein [Solirubrobacterales bacterium]
MARCRTLLAFVVALLALAVGTSAAHPLVPPQHQPFYSVAPRGPYAVGEAPTDIVSGDFDPQEEDFDPTWHDFEKRLMIGYAQGSRAKVFYASRRPPGLHEFGWLGAPGSPAVLDADDSHLSVLSPTRGRVFELSFRTRPFPKPTLRIGPEPVAAVFADFIASLQGLDDTEIAVADHRTGRLQLFTRDGGKDFRLAGNVPLGPEPTAASVGDCCLPLFVTTAGNNRLTLLNHFENGEFRERRSFRVGNRPSALAVADLVAGGYGYEEVAVANRGSDDVTILATRGPTYEFRTIGTYPVGHEPVAISALDIDQRGGFDLAVVNQGSEDVTILLSQGRRFRSGGTFPVGKHPVALAAFDYNRAFKPDLAVVNRGSDDVTVLTRRVDGRCRDHEAQRVVGTKGPDRLWGVGGGANETKGFGGADRIDGGAGVDCLAGEGGGDLIRGGALGDLVDGGAGDDVLYGERRAGFLQPPGGDTLIGGPGEDRIDAGKGDDRILAADGERDRIDCGKGRDLAVVDRIDKTKNCERVRISSAASRPAPRAARPARSPRGRG